LEKQLEKRSGWSKYAAVDAIRSANPISPARRSIMAEPIERITPQQAHERMARPTGALRVCGYDDKQKFQQNRLDGALSLDEFRAQLGAIPRDREIVFYCA
jgi:hypothetical protein